MQEDRGTEESNLLERSATVLSYAGILPICTAAFLLWIPQSVLGDSLAISLRSFALTFQNWAQYYCAIILSFLGAVHWGAVIGKQTSGGAATPPRTNLTYAVLPALFGWFVLLPNNIVSGFILSYAIRFCLLGAGFGFALHVDLKAVKSGWLPAWYGALRKSVTLWVIVFIVLIILKLILEGHW